MKKLFLLSVLFSLCAVNILYSQPSKEEIKGAEFFFKEFDKMCSKENGELWGVSYCSSLILIDRENRLIFSQAPININSKQNHKGSVYYYTAPNDMLLSCGVTKIDNKNYATVDINEQDINLIIETAFHEITHKFQYDSDYNLSYNNSHAETKFGQLYIRLESMALINALSNKGDLRRDYIKDALYFREKRQNMFKGAKENETKFELSEGLAEFSGIYLTYGDTAINVFLSRFNKNIGEDRIGVRVFGYNTGAAYSFLNKDSLHWNYNVYKLGDITQITRKIYNIGDKELSSIDEALLFKKYNYDALFQKEDSIEKAINDRNLSFLEKLEKGKTLKIKLDDECIFGMNPNTQTIISEGITYYQDLEFTSSLGRIYSHIGCFLKSNYFYFILPDDLTLKEINEDYCNEKLCFKLNANFEIVKQGNNYIIESK